MIHIRISKIIVALSCAILALLPGFNNIIDYNVNLVHVQHVLMMDTHVVEVGSSGMRSIQSPFIHHLAYISIIISELLIGVLGIWGCIDLWKVRKDANLFNQNKTKVIWSMTLGVLVWFTGFMVIGGEWFLMWLSEEWNSQQAAFRLVVPFMLGLIYVSAKDEEFSHNPLTA